MKAEISKADEKDTENDRALSAEEVRRRRLAYFQNLPGEKSRSQSPPHDKIIPSNFSQSEFYSKKTNDPADKNYRSFGTTSNGAHFSLEQSSKIVHHEFTSFKEPRESSLKNPEERESNSFSGQRSYDAFNEPPDGATDIGATKESHDEKDEFALLRDELKRKSQTGDETGYSNAVERLIQLAKKEIAESEQQKILSSREGSVDLHKNSLGVPNQSTNNFMPNFSNSGSNSFDAYGEGEKESGGPRHSYDSRDPAGHRISDNATEKYEQFFSRGQVSSQKPEQHLRKSFGRDLRDSHEVDASIVFQKSVDFDQAESLGLSTHRPDSPGSDLVSSTHVPIENHTKESPRAFEEFESEDFKIALGEKRYNEFLLKASKEIDLFHGKHPGNENNMDGTEKSSKRKVEKQSDSKSKSIPTEKEFGKDSSSKPVSILKGHDKPDKISRPSLKLNLKDSKEKSPEDINGVYTRGESFDSSYEHGTDGNVHRPLLNRPRFEPSNIYQQQNSQDGEVDNLSLPPSYRQGYDKPGVSRNVVFTANEIYQQAFKGQFMSPPGTYRGEPQSTSIGSPALSRGYNMYTQSKYQSQEAVPQPGSSPQNYYQVTSPGGYFGSTPPSPATQYQFAHPGYQMPMPHPPSRGDTVMPPHASQTSFRMPHPPPTESGDYQYFQQHSARSYQTPDGVDMSKFVPHQPPKMPHPPPQNTKSTNFAEPVPAGEYPLRYYPPNLSQSMPPNMAPMFPYPHDMSMMQFPPWGGGDMSDFNNHYPQSPGGIPYPPPPYNVDLNAYLQFLGSQGYPVPHHMFASQMQERYAKASENPNLEHRQSESTVGDNKQDMMIPHPPLQQRKENSEKQKVRKSSPQRTPKPEASEQSSKTSSQRHIDGIRMHHEQRRQQDAEEDAVLDKQRKFAKASIDRYFSSLEKLYGRDKHGDDVEEKSEVSASKSDECLNEEIIDEVASDVEAETMVNTEVTAASSVKAEGITERIDRLGIDLSFLKASVSEEEALKKGQSQEDPKESGDMDKKSRTVIVCPECEEANKPYMSWCGKCGEVLIGIDPTVVKKTKSGKVVQKQKIRNQHRNKDATKSEENNVSKANNKSSDNIGNVNSSEALQKTKVSPNKSDSRDSGRPSSDDLDITRSEKEVADICENITDPIVKGFIKSYFRKKRADVMEKQEQGSKVKEDTKVPDAGGDAPSGQADIVEKEDERGMQSISVDPDISAKLLDSQENFWLHEQPQKKKKIKSFKKGNSAPIDIEIFGVEESKQSRNSSRGSQPLVPVLNLINSSDEEENSVADQPDEVSVFQSIDSSVLNEFFEPPEEKPPSPEPEEVSQPFLAQVIDNLKTPVSKLPPNKASSSKKSKVVRKSVVRESIEAPGYQRKWEKSSTAWSSYHPRELSTKSSLHGKAERPSSASASSQMMRKSGSADNLLQTEAQSNESTDRKGPPVGKKQRPVSADISKRRQTPSSAQYRNRKSPNTLTNSQINGNYSSSPEPNSSNVVDTRRDIPVPLESPPSNPNTAWASNTGNSRGQGAKPSFRGRGNRPSSASAAPQSARRSSSTDNLLVNEAEESNDSRGYMMGRKQRPVSADISKRRQNLSSNQGKNPRVSEATANGMSNGNSGSSTSPNQKPNVSINLDSPSSSVLPGVVDHRLLSSEVTTDVDLPHSNPAAALQTYSKYHKMTPRIRDGHFSAWLCLPDEILLHIFSYLPHSDLAHCAQTCKQYHRVAMDDSLWRYITLKKNHGLTDESFLHIGKHHPISLALIQCHGDYVTAKGLREMFKECGNSLREINLCGSSRGALTGDCVLLHASARCKNITHVDASWCNVTDSGIGAISSTSNRLESLCINGCQLISDEGLEIVIKKHGKSLRVLEMFGCFNITPKGMRYLASNCINLLTLNLGQCYKLTDSCITQLSSSLGRVENLDLRGCKHIKDNSIRFVVKNCPRLKMISLANCPNISDVSMLEISTYLNDIRTIDVCGCRNITDSSIRAIANNCQNLRNIDISSTGCTHRSVSMLANFCSQRLESVKLNFLSDITENSILKLVKHCKRLKLLHLYGCTSIRTLDKIKQAKPDLKVEM